MALIAGFDGETELAEAGVGFGAAGVLVGFQRPAGGVLDGEGEDVFGREMAAVVDQAEAGGAAVFGDAVAVDFLEGALDVGSSDFGDGHGADAPLILC